MTIDAISSANMQNRTVGIQNSMYRVAPITNETLSLFDEKTKNMLVKKKLLTKLQVLGYNAIGFGINAIDPVLGSAYDIFLQHKFKK
jgi:hypothetical protein